MERECLPKVPAMVVLMVAAVKKYVEKPSLTTLTFVPRGLATQSGQSERELAFSTNKHPELEGFWQLYFMPGFPKLGLMKELQGNYELMKR